MAGNHVISRLHLATSVNYDEVPYGGIMLLKYATLVPFVGKDIRGVPSNLNILFS